MAHPYHVLFDDGSLIEFGGHVVGGGTDDLDPPFVGLVVGVPAGESRQEGVMDVDDPVGESIQDRVAEDLHVAGQYDQIDVLLLEESQHGALLLCLVYHRQVVVGDAEIAGGLGVVGMIADHQGDLGGELLHAPPRQQVVHAVRLLGHQQGHPPRLVRETEAPPHVEPFRQWTERPAEFGARKIHAVQLELDPLQEEAFLLIGVLVGVDDVGPMTEQEVRHPGDQALAVGTRQQQRSGDRLRHGARG